MSTTIDHEGRRRLAELSRHFAAGLITNDEFVDEVPPQDKWALTPEGRAWVARIILFLRADSPYRYPIATGLRAIPIMLLSLATLGGFGRFWLRRQRSQGDESVWPFYCRAEYEQALRNPALPVSGGVR